MRAWDFILVAKPGIVLGNLMVGVGAFCFGAQDVRFDWLRLAAFASGMALIVAGSCVLNNYYDRDIDRLMKRTATRPSATGVLPLSVALPYSAVLFGFGFWLLVAHVNWQTALIGLIGAVLYAFVYSYAKRRTHHATLIGTVPGATPPLAGYVAATGQFDLAAWLLFALLVAWQMPHFYAIALFRRKEYARAGVPVLPVVKSIRRTVWEMRMYAAVFVVATLCFALFSGAKLITGILLCSIGIIWLRQVLRTPDYENGTKWARTVFKHSLYLLPVMSILLATNRLW